MSALDELRAILERETEAAKVAYAAWDDRVYDRDGEEAYNVAAGRAELATELLKAAEAAEWRGTEQGWAYRAGLAEGAGWTLANALRVLADRTDVLQAKVYLLAGGGDASTLLGLSRQHAVNALHDARAVLERVGPIVRVVDEHVGESAR